MQKQNKEMGSEGPKSVVINVSGFKKFQGVAENPTETVVNNLRSFVEKRGLPSGLTLGSCTILETAGDGASPALYKAMDSGISKTGSTTNEQVVWVSVSFLIQILTFIWKFGWPEMKIVNIIFRSQMIEIDFT